MKNNLKLILNISNKTKFKISKNYLFSLAKEKLFEKKISGNLELDLSIVNEREMAKINNDYRKIDRSTDVLSFPIYEKNKLLTLIKDAAIRILIGQIVICFPVAKREAKNKNISTKEEIGYLFLHGLDHLLGYHHKD